MLVRFIECALDRFICELSYFSYHILNMPIKDHIKGFLIYLPVSILF